MATRRNVVLSVAGAVVFLLASMGWGESYVVQSGDSLSSIAERELGDSGRWEEIANLNGIGAPYQIAVGSQLTLPGASEIEGRGSEAAGGKAEEELSKLPFLGESAREWWPVVKGFGKVAGIIAGCVVLVCSFYVGVCLKISCRLFGVTCSFGRSLVAGLWLVLAHITSYGLLAAMVILTLSVLILPVAYLLSFVGYFVVSLLIIKKAVKCNWLESAGLFCVSGMVATFLACVVGFVLSITGGAMLERALTLCMQQ